MSLTLAKAAQLSQSPVVRRFHLRHGFREGTQLLQRQHETVHHCWPVRRQIAPFAGVLLQIVERRTQIQRLWNEEY